MKWKLSSRAEADLRRIAHRIAADNPAAAAKWLVKVRAPMRLAARSPRAGRKVPELDRDDIREAIVGAYRMVYVLRANTVVIVTIFEGHQLLPELT